MSQVSSVDRANIQAFPLQPAPNNPPTGTVLLYADQGTGQLVSLTSSGASSSGVVPSTAPVHKFATAILPSGVIVWTQPAFTDISGTAVANQYVMMVGDSGSGGTQGAVPAPASGDAAAGKFLKADGVWTVPSGGGGSPGGATNSIQYNNAGAFAGSLILAPCGSLLPNLIFRNAYKNVTATGNVDIYTCPTNKRAIACEVEVYNNSGFSMTMYTTAKISGTYYQTTPTTSIGNNGTGSRSAHYILEAGEILAVNVNQQPCNVWVGIFEFDNTSNLKSGKLTTFINGDNTVYTVPANKTAVILPNTLIATSGSVGTLSYGNSSSTTRTVAFNLVNSGGSPGSTNQISASTSVPSPNATFSPTIIGLTAVAGDFFSVNTDGTQAGQFAFCTVVEI